MNSDRSGNQSTWAVYVVAAFGTLFIMAALVGAMIHYTRPAPLNTARINERYENLKKLRAEEAKDFERIRLAGPGQRLRSSPDHERDGVDRPRISESLPRPARI